MGSFTPLPLDEAQALGRAFGLEVREVVPIEAGSVNSNFQLVTREGSRYFARIYEEQRGEGARAELRLLRELRATGLPVVVPLSRLDGGEVGFVASKPFAIYPWVDGAVLCQARVHPAHCEQVGAALARLHQAAPHLTRLCGGRFRVEDLRARLDHIDREGPQYAGSTARIRASLGRYANTRDRELPRGVIHGDLFRDNVLWAPANSEELGAGRVEVGPIAALIDFESASEGPFVFDLMVCLLSWCYTDRLEPRLVRAMVHGYGAVRPLEPAERRALTVEGALVALRFATTRITDFAMRTPPGDPPKRDFRRFLDRLDALERGELDSILEGGRVRG